MLNILNQLFCSHRYELNRWHRCHGPNGNDPPTIEAEYICSKCGKVSYLYHPIDQEKTFGMFLKENERRNQQC